MQEYTTLKLEDLQPEEAELVLSGMLSPLHLRKLTLNGRIWLSKRFKQGELSEIFKDTKIEEMSEIAYYLLKEKEAFKTIEDFREAISTPKDIVAMVQALLTTIGLSEPVIQRIAKEAEDEKNQASLSQPTGAQSTT